MVEPRRGAPRSLMLVSERADSALREAVAEGRRPCPEYLRLESDHGVELLDWSMLPGRVAGRSATVSLRHARQALARLDEFEAVFSDGEHVAVPLALAMRMLRRAKPHLVLGHHLTTSGKRPFFRVLGAQRGMTRILVHSRRQLELAERDLGIRSEQLAFIPYFADSDFWRPQAVAEEPLVVAAGREHRDYQTLAAACADLPVSVFVGAGSLHSPSARSSQPLAWPGNFSSAFAPHPLLRSWYARASVVAVPLVPTDFQAGITTLLEAMAMGKAVVVSATEGQRDVVRDGETGIVVRPGDPRELRLAIQRLVQDPAERGRLGANARRAVESEFSLDRYAGRLARHLREITTRHPAPVA